MLQKVIKIKDGKIISGQEGGAFDITWDEWQQLSDQEKEGTLWHITDVPGADGSIEVENMKLLWENQSPTSTFVAQNITLNSDDYDFLVVLAYYSYTNKQLVTPIIIDKNSIGGYLNFADWSSNPLNTYRYISFVDTTHLAIGDANRNGNITNGQLIPYQIYGFKKSVKIKFDALAQNVSTSADKCMMSDGETSVADALEYEQLSVTIASGVTSAAVRCERLGKLVMLNFRGIVTPSSNLIILSGLPVPKGAIPFATNVGSGAPSLFQIETDGVLKLISPGSTGSGYFGVTLSYVAN